MKQSNKFLTYISLAIMILTVSSCVNDDDYSIPPIDVESVNPATEFASLFNGVMTNATETTFNAVVGRYEQAVVDGDQIGVFSTEFDTPQYITGYVVSSDEGGNFFEEIIVQNSVDDQDPDGDTRQGIKVEINTRSLSDTYDFGRKVYIKLNGLVVGESNGVLTLGRAEGNDVGQIQEFEYRNFVVRDAEVATITPKMVNPNDLTETDENTYVQLSNMQINRNQLTLTFAGESSDEFDGFRSLESCEGGGSITLQTSTFADFKSLPVPQGAGSISGIFTRDFGDDLNVFVINSIADIDMVGERCDPDFLECSTSGNGTSTIFDENFESFGTFDSEGWINLNINGGNVDWGEGSFSGNAYAQISGFSSNENPITVWLVTPMIDLTGTTGANLSFDVQTNFNNGNILSAFITDDFTGDVTTTEWQILDVSIPEGSSTGFGNFESVGPVNISCLSGEVYVAFFYEGADPGPTTRYHIDNVEVKVD
ncbi:DUF5689 domain-containing protein [Ichthyenterobacterium sp. W332]|uniref:DUF5689 domain-containing protein n=1 Tax=Microcosmobacter mediterraneus TaxID=3075607 RepID=A0ABU2YNJ5_9FLAO|nr:DUF5689 domain-containing protein [Ichthyenterobacterium sp. W332]MDT0558628.1 DUF5689 domain-containing protein [Ichthyenterobacterium sp. W332]